MRKSARRARAKKCGEKRDERQHFGGVAAKERTNKQTKRASTFLTGVRDRRLSHLKITVVVMTRIITLVLFLLLSRDIASSTVVVFYRDIVMLSMPRLHATEWGKKGRIFLIRYSYPRAIYTRTKREEEKEHHQ